MSLSDHARACALGDLYEELAALYAASCDPAIQRRDLSRILDRYPNADVAWMIQVVAEDRNAT